MNRPYEHYDEPQLRSMLNAPNIGEVGKRNVRIELAIRGAIETAQPMRELAVPAAGSTQVGVMNKTETRYAARLDADPDVLGWLYESVKVRSGVERAWLTPDFFVRYRDGTFGFDEVKGRFVREDARAKFQAAAGLHKWARWRLWMWKDSEWRLIHDYPAGGE